MRAEEDAGQPGRVFRRNSLPEVWLRQPPPAPPPPHPPGPCFCHGIADRAITALVRIINPLRYRALPMPCCVSAKLGPAQCLPSRQDAGHPGELSLTTPPPPPPGPNPAVAAPHPTHTAPLIDGGVTLLIRACVEHPKPPRWDVTAGVWSDAVLRRNARLCGPRYPANIRSADCRHAGTPAMYEQ